MDDLKQYFNAKSLRLAWERMISSTGRDVKDFFGIQLYSKNLKVNLEKLSETILTSNFKPSRPFKYYEPKSSRTQRTKSVLNVEDAIFYQAIVNKIAQNNFERLNQFRHCVFSQVLHEDVKLGERILDEPEADYYFFELYVPYYNQFLQSINQEVENKKIKYKLETDITGFFDSIPHSNLLILLKRKFGVKKEILELLANALNIWSGTRQSLTPGIGIPQGASASFFLGNLYLFDLDEVMSSHNYHYYRYLDDIRVYSETESKLSEALVRIDTELKGEGLSLNTKKTAVEALSTSRSKEKKKPLNEYEKDDEISEQTNAKKSKLIRDILKEQQNADLKEQSSPLTDDDLTDEELYFLCRQEIEDIEKILDSLYSEVVSNPEKKRLLLTDENKKREFINFAYRWRTAMAIIRELGITTSASQNLIDVWLFGLENFFWKANHFCWNLTQYGENVYIKDRLKKAYSHFSYYEWVRYQILSNLTIAQRHSAEEMLEYVALLARENSDLVRLGIYKLLLVHLSKTDDRWPVINEAIKKEREIYLKKMLILEERQTGSYSSSIYKNWLGL